MTRLPRLRRVEGRRERTEMRAVRGVLWLIGLAAGIAFVRPTVAAGGVAGLDAKTVLTLGVWVWNAWAVALVVLLLAFPGGRLTERLDWILVAAVFVPAIPMQALWLLFLESPTNAFLVWPDAGAAAGVDTAQRVIALASFVVLDAVLVRRWLGASDPLRRVLT